LGELDTKTENWKKGIEYIMKQYWKVLENHNIEEIKTIGENFDPNLHEAVSEEEVEDKSQLGKIIKEIDSGYMMNKKVIKVAKVILAK
jgi:molecular chaperone GrpE